MKGKTGIQEWSAPETRKFAAYDEKCDLWAVGCILYYLCTYQLSDNLIGIRDELISNCTDKFLKEKIEERANLQDLITKLLETDPLQRPSSKDAI
jgi:serine/threonine protein kinase